MAKPEFLVLRGVVNYAKIIGNARPHTGLKKYDKGPYWSLELSPDASSRQLLVKKGLEDKMKSPLVDGKGKPKKADPNRAGAKLRSGEVIDANADRISLKVLENRSDGTKNSPPTVKDIRGNDWGSDLIGNGTVADVKVKIVDYGEDSEAGMYLQNVRILELVPYEREDMEPLSEDDEYFSQAEGDDFAEPESVSHPDDYAPASNVDDLDDDVPY